MRLIITSVVLLVLSQVKTLYVQSDQQVPTCVPASIETLSRIQQIDLEGFTQFCVKKATGQTFGFDYSKTKRYYNSYFDSDDNKVKYRPKLVNCYDIDKALNRLRTKKLPFAYAPLNDEIATMVVVVAEAEPFLFTIYSPVLNKTFQLTEQQMRTAAEQDFWAVFLDY